jgi:hypothetical protein
MAGIALLLDLAKRNPSFSSSGKSIHAHTLVSAAAAASAAAISFTAGLPLSSRFLFGLVILLKVCFIFYLMRLLPNRVVSEGF